MIIRRFDIGVIGVDHPPNENPIYPGPPSSRSLGCSFHPRVRSSHPRHSSPSFHLRGCRESFRRSSFSQTARNRSALADESPGIPFPPRRRQVPGLEISIFHTQDFSSRSPPSPFPAASPPAVASPYVVICSRWIFQFLNIEVIEIASFSFLSAACRSGRSSSRFQE